MINKSSRRLPLRIGVTLFFVIYIALAVHSEYWLGIVTTHPIGDDFKIYYGAYLKALAGDNPYEPYGIGSGFIYHPAALTFVGLFSGSGDQWVSTYLWITISLLAWGVSIWLAMRLARSAWTTECKIPGMALVRPWLVVAIFLNFAPFWETLHIGQINTFVLVCLLLSLHFAQNDKPVPSGIALAFAIVLKTSPFILLAYFAVMRKFRVIASALAGVLVLSAVAALQFSAAVFNQFWDVLPRLASEVYPDTYNQSILSVLSQILISRGGNHFESALMVGHRLAFASVVGVLLAIGWFIYSSAKRLSAWLFMALLTVIVFFSPLVWYHHSTLLLLPLCALLLSPSRVSFITGLSLVFILQAERLFEQFVTRAAYPIVATHAVLIGFLCAICFRYELVSPNKI